MKAQLNMNQNRFMPLYGYIFLAALFVKQFYAKASGSVQYGDMLFALSFVLMLLSSNSNYVFQENRKLSFFIVLTGLVNGIYGVLYSNSAIIYSTIYFVFNLFVVLVFDSLIDSEKFLKLFEKVVKICLLSQLAILQLGRGTYVEGRYLGTFNDPNQYGFYIFSLFLMLVLLFKLTDKGIIFWSLISFYLILPCASTGMALGFMIVISLRILFRENTNSGATVFQIVLIAIAGFMLIAVSKGGISLPSSISDSFMFQRIIGKLNDVQNSTGSTSHDRNWDKVFNNLGYIFIGCGEGIFWRFGNGNEVHSTVLGLIWYYGIIPCGVLISWMRSKLVGVSKTVWCVYIALLIEAVTLVNHRQPMFWMLFVIARLNEMKNRAYQEYYLGELEE